MERSPGTPGAVLAGSDAASAVGAEPKARVWSNVPKMQFPVSFLRKVAEQAEEAGSRNSDGSTGADAGLSEALKAAFHK